MRNLWHVCGALTLTLSLTGAALAARPAPAKPGPAAREADKGEGATLYEDAANSVVTIFVDDGLGAGVVVHPDGYVVTAAHVVEGAQTIGIQYRDGTRTYADVVTLSRTEDLALLKVGLVPEGVRIPKLGDSDKLRIGEDVFALGAPLGLTHTLTRGVISAIRKDFGPKHLQMPHNVIQIDAAINTGNSGGAIFNMRGEVVGIASFITTPSGGSVGLGFAVPSNVVRRRLFDEAIPYIGVSLRRVPTALAELLNWPVSEPLLVEHVTPGSAAARAGLMGGEIEADIGGLKLMLGGDLIIKVGEFETRQAKEIHAYLKGLKVGDLISYTVIRSGKPEMIEVAVEKVPVLPKL